MKVWLCYECTYDFCDTHYHLEKVFGSEAAAQQWVKEKTPKVYKGVEIEWREYEEKEVE